MTVPRQISVLTPPIHPPSTSPGIFHQVIILLCASRALKHRCLTFAQVPKKYRSNLYPPNLLPTGNGDGSQLIYGPLPGPLWSFYPFCSSCSLLSFCTSPFSWLIWSNNSVCIGLNLDTFISIFKKTLSDSLLFPNKIKAASHRLLNSFLISCFFTFLLGNLFP